MSDSPMPAEFLTRKLTKVAVLVMVGIAVLLTLVSTAGANRIATPSQDYAHQFGPAHAQVAVTHTDGYYQKSFPDKKATRQQVRDAVEAATGRPTLMVAGDTVSSPHMQGPHQDVGVLWTANPTGVGAKVKLESGRLPSARNEILIAPDLVTTEAKIGDKVAATDKNGVKYEWTIVGTGRGYFRTDPEPVVAYGDQEFLSQRAWGNERWLLTGDPLSDNELRQISESHPSMAVRVARPGNLLEWLAVHSAFVNLPIALLLAICTIAFAWFCVDKLKTLRDSSAPDDSQAGLSRHAVDVQHSQIARLAVRAGVSGVLASLVVGGLLCFLKAYQGESLQLAFSQTLFIALLCLALPMVAAATVFAVDNRRTARQRRSSQGQKRDLKLAQRAGRSLVVFAAGAFIWAALLGIDVESLRQGQVAWQMGPHYVNQVVIAIAVYGIVFVWLMRRWGSQLVTLVMPMGAAWGWLASTAPHFGGGFAVLGLVPVHLGVTLASLFVVSFRSVWRRYHGPAPTSTA